MNQRIKLGIEAIPGSSWLTLSVPQDCFDRAVLGEPGLTKRMRQHSGYLYKRPVPDGFSGIKLGVHALAIGRITDLREKMTVVDNVTDIIGTLANDVQSPQQSDERLDLLDFYPLNHRSNAFAFRTVVRMPQADNVTASAIVRKHMFNAARDLQYQLSDQAKVTVEIGDEDGIGIRVGEVSSIYTLTGKPEPGHRAELFSDNMARHFEPVVYLIGAVALARADELLPRSK